MAYYSKIAEVKYSDNELGITIPIRIKLIEVEHYKHPEKKDGCPETWGTLKDLDYHYRRYILKDRTQKDVTTEDKMIKGKFYPPEMFDEHNQVLCPKCKEPLRKFKKPIFKLYTGKIHPFIDVARILSYTTLFRWKHKVVHTTTYGGEEISTYKDKLEDVYKDLEESKKLKFQTRRKQKIKLKVYKGTNMKKLEKELNDYKGRKIIKEL